MASETKQTSKRGHYQLRKSRQRSAPLLWIDEPTVRRLVDVASMLDPLRRALIAISSGSVSVPPRSIANASTGSLIAMPGWLPGQALEAKLVTVFPSNHDVGMPSHHAVIALFDEASGRPLALMGGTFITAMRTAVTSALAIGQLALPKASTLAILGAGTQGAAHLEALMAMRKFADIRIASRSSEHAAELASKHPEARAVASFEMAVRGADVVACCTDARAPVIDASWLGEGVHVNSVGGTFGPEIDRKTIGRGRIFVEWKGAASNPPPVGSYDLQGVGEDRIVEIGEVLAGRHVGRMASDEITIFKSTGHAAEDASIARLVYEQARVHEAGVELTLGS